MITTRLELVQALRAMAARGDGASALARFVIARHPIEPLDRFLLDDYFREAFCFHEGEGSPLYGWLPDGSSYLNDDQLDGHMARRIAKTRPEWGAAERLPAA